MLQRFFKLRLFSTEVNSFVTSFDNRLANYAIAPENLSDESLSRPIFYCLFRSPWSNEEDENAACAINAFNHLCKIRNFSMDEKKDALKHAGTFTTSNSVLFALSSIKEVMDQTIFERFSFKLAALNHTSDDAFEKWLEINSELIVTKDVAMAGLVFYGRKLDFKRAEALLSDYQLWDDSEALSRLIKGVCTHNPSLVVEKYNHYFVDRKVPPCNEVVFQVGNALTKLRSSATDIEKMLASSGLTLDAMNVNILARSFIKEKDYERAKKIILNNINVWNMKPDSATVRLLIRCSYFIDQNINSVLEIISKYSKEGVVLDSNVGATFVDVAMSLKTTKPELLRMISLINQEFNVPITSDALASYLKNHTNFSLETLKAELIQISQTYKFVPNEYVFIAASEKFKDEPGSLYELIKFFRSEFKMIPSLCSLYSMITAYGEKEKTHKYPQLLQWYSRFGVEPNIGIINKMIFYYEKHRDLESRLPLLTESLVKLGAFPSAHNLACVVRDMNGTLDDKLEFIDKWNSLYDIIPTEKVFGTLLKGNSGEYDKIVTSLSKFNLKPDNDAKHDLLMEWIETRNIEMAIPHFKVLVEEDVMKVDTITLNRIVSRVAKWKPDDSNMEKANELLDCAFKLGYKPDIDTIHSLIYISGNFNAPSELNKIISLFETYYIAPNKFTCNFITENRIRTGQVDDMNVIVAAFKKKFKIGESTLKKKNENTRRYGLKVDDKFEPEKEKNASLKKNTNLQGKFRSFKLKSVEDIQDEVPSSQKKYKRVDPYPLIEEEEDEWQEEDNEDRFVGRSGGTNKFDVDKEINEVESISNGSKKKQSDSKGYNYLKYEKKGKTKKFDLKEKVNYDSKSNVVKKKYSDAEGSNTDYRKDERFGKAKKFDSDYEINKDYETRSTKKKYSDSKWSNTNYRREYDIPKSKTFSKKTSNQEFLEHDLFESNRFDKNSNFSERRNNDSFKSKNNSSKSWKSHDDFEDDDGEFVKEIVSTAGNHRKSGDLKKSKGFTDNKKNKMKKSIANKSF